MDKEELIKLRNELSSDCIDDPEDLFCEIDTIIKLIDFWLEHNGGLKNKQK